MPCRRPLFVGGYIAISFMENKVFFVSGIDTDAGKSYATAYLACEWNKKGIRTITQKFIQTGNVGHSEDIDLHRKIMVREGVISKSKLPADKTFITANVKILNGDEAAEAERLGVMSWPLTSPEIYSYPASPLLSSRLDNRPVNFGKIEAATSILAERYDRVLLEGAGGLMVPIAEKSDSRIAEMVKEMEKAGYPSAKNANNAILTIDYVAYKKYPMVFVSSGKLGSVNHTLLSLEAIETRGIKIAYFCYNLYPELEDKTILSDTMDYLKREVAVRFPEAEFVEIPVAE